MGMLLEFAERAEGYAQATILRAREHPRALSLTPRHEAHGLDGAQGLAHGMPADGVAVAEDFLGRQEAADRIGSSGDPGDDLVGDAPVERSDLRLSGSVICSICWHLSDRSNVDASNVTVSLNASVRPTLGGCIRRSYDSCHTKVGNTPSKVAPNARTAALSSGVGRRSEAT